MLDKIKFWYYDNQFQIAWFFIGFFTLDVIVRIGRGELFEAIFSLLLVVINYILVRK